MPMMPRIRSVKPEIFMHEGLFELAKNHQWPVQFVFIGLFTCCDRAGRFCWHPRHLKTCILPYHDLDMSEVLEVFVTHGFIKKYEHQGEWYGCIPSWSKHQVIKHEAESILPPFDDPNWVKPEPTKTHSECFDAKSDGPFLQPFLAMPPPEIENKNPIQNNGLKTSESPAPRVGVRGSRGTCGREGKGEEGRGKEGKGSKREEQPLVAPEARPPFAADPVSLIFNHWQTVMKHPLAKLDRDRQSLIKRALKWRYSVEQLCTAITGCSITPHNQGDNDRGERFDGLHIILKNAEQIERFIRHYKNPPQPKSDATRRTNANVHTLHEWGQEKLAEEIRNGIR